MFNKLGLNNVPVNRGKNWPIKYNHVIEFK